MFLLLIYKCSLYILNKKVFYETYDSQISPILPLPSLNAQKFLNSNEVQFI